MKAVIPVEQVIDMALDRSLPTPIVLEYSTHKGSMFPLVVPQERSGFSPTISVPAGRYPQP